MNGIEFLFDRINYERRSHLPYSEQRLKLENMRRLLRLLGQPHTRYPVVHIAGTKGKGSVATSLTSILLNSGYRVGTYTSPHMHHVGERFLLNGQITSPETVLELVERIRPFVELLDHQAEETNNAFDRPTFFEITTAMAFEFFATQHVDCAVAEVGLGGRLDSTNVCNPIISVISSISFDHTRQLGKTLAEIAREKAGIIKEGIPVVSGVTQPEPRDEIRRIAGQRSASLLELGHDFVIRPGNTLQQAPPSNGQHGTKRFRLPPPLEFDFEANLNGEKLEMVGLTAGHTGQHQQRNAAVTIACAMLIRSQFPNIRESTIRAGLSCASMQGRIELLTDQPPIIVDVAHNVASAQALIDTIAPAISEWDSTLIYATSRDKDYEGVLNVILPHFRRAIFTRFLENPRCRAPEEILLAAEKIVSKSGLKIQLESIDNPTDALNLAIDADCTRNLICVTGSVFIVAELREMIKTRFDQPVPVSGECDG